MNPTGFDTQTARHLVRDLSAQVERLPAGSVRFELEKELARVQSLLEEAGTSGDALHSGFRSLHSVVDRGKEELQRDGLQAGLVLQAIGRMLGLD